MVFLGMCPLFQTPREHFFCGIITEPPGEKTNQTFYLLFCLPRASHSFQPLKALLLLSALSKDLRWSIYNVYRVLGWKDVLKIPWMKRCCKKIIFTLIDWLQSIVPWISGWVFIHLIFYSYVQMLWTTMTPLKSLLALASISNIESTLISCVLKKTMKSPRSH